MILKTALHVQVIMIRKLPELLQASRRPVKMKLQRLNCPVFL